MKKIEKLAEMIEADPIDVASCECPSDYGMKNSNLCYSKDLKACYHCWMEEVEEVEE